MSCSCFCVSTIALIACIPPMLEAYCLHIGRITARHGARSGRTILAPLTTLRSGASLPFLVCVWL